MKRLISVVLPLLLVVGCVTPAREPRGSPASLTAPKPILALIEWNDWGGGGHPWPIELRLVAYDNGLVIRQASRNRDPLAQPRFVWQQLDPQEIQDWVATAKAVLPDIVPTEETAEVPLHLGYTHVEYWGAGDAQPVRVSAYGMPCRSPGDTVAAAPDVDIRAITHPSFLKFCDFLLGQPLADAEAWAPETITVELFRSSTAPERIVELPAEWPKQPIADSKPDQQSVEICVPVGPTPDHLTAEILDPESEAWSQLTGFQLFGGSWWVAPAFTARVSLPAAINGDYGPC